MEGSVLYSKKTSLRKDDDDMTKKPERLPILMVLLALSAAGYMLRARQLRVGFDAAGLPTGQGLALLVILCALAVLLAAFAALGVRKRPAFADNFTDHRIPTVLLVAAAGLLAGGCVFDLMDRQMGATSVELLLSRVAGALGVASGLCFVAMGAIRHQGKKPAAAAWLIPVVYYILQTVFSFKTWSTDPVIVDYCFKLFALITAMLSAFHAAGFVFDAGSRRSCLFFCLCGVFFSCVTLADGGTPHIMRTAGAALFMLATAFELLGEKKEPCEESEAACDSPAL